MSDPFGFPRNFELSLMIDWTLEDYWHIHLHDPSNGAIREIFPIDTIKGHLILTCAQDGSLLVHEIGKGYLFSEFSSSSKIFYRDFNWQYCKGKSKVN